MKEKPPLSEEGYLLMGAAFEVHNEQGGGLLEEIYQECLEIELKERDIPFTAQEQLRIFYKGIELKKRYIPDLVVYDQLLVELKAVTALTAEHEAQLLNYMRLTRMPVGYLLNFGPIGELGWERFILSEFVSTT